MKELSLYILDITENSVRAGAKNITVSIEEKGSEFRLTVIDDGCGMKQEIVDRLSDPFYTTRTTRKVGLGVPFLTLAAEQTGGGVSITSKHIEEHPDDHGTVLEATFDSSHIDFIPLGDIVSTFVTLIQGSPDIDFLFRHIKDGSAMELDTKQIREVLGEDVPLSNAEVLGWIRGFVNEQYDEWDK